MPSKKSSAIGLALLMTTMLPTKPLQSLFVSPALAQTAAPTAFPLPPSVPQGTTVRIDGSSSMAALNEGLKQRFESQYSGSSVNINYAGTPAGMQALRDGKADLAAIGRPLTGEERNQGFVPVALERGKIALIVNPDNPFKGSITVPQFVKIVRGEITDWSELGGAPGKIRFVDRPDLSDTRAAFRNYSVFINSPYQTSNTADRTSEDSTQAVAQQLGKDGLSYAPANQVLNQSAVRIVPMHNTLPTDPRYPFSQPFYYVYKGTPSPAVAAFLGYATSPPGKQTTQTAATNPKELAIEPAKLLAAGSVAAAGLNAPAGSGGSPTSTNQAPAAPGSPTVGAVPPAPNSSDAGIPSWLWWLLLLGLGAALLGWLLRRRTRPGVPEATTPAAAPPVTEPSPPVAEVPPPPPLMTPSDEAEPDLAARAGTVINSDRASISEVQSLEISPAALPPHGDVLAGGAALIGGAAALAGAESSKVEPVPPVEASPEIPEGDGAMTRGQPEPPPVPRSGEVPSPEIPEGGGVMTSGQSRATRPIVEVRSVAPTDAPPPRPLVEIRQVPPIVPQATAISSEFASDTPTVPERPTLIDVPIAAEPPSIEPPEAPPASSDTNLDVTSGAILGGAAIGATALTGQLGSNPTEPEPLATFDAIEDLNTVDAIEQTPIELNLDDAPSIVESGTSLELTPELAALGGASAITVDDAATNEPVSGELVEPEILTGETIPTPTEIEQNSIVETTREPSPDAADSTLESTQTIPAIEALGGAAIAAGVAVGALGSNAQSDVEAAKFDVGQTDLSSETLATVDQGLLDLPDGYGESRIVLMPRDPHWAYAYWDIANEHKEDVRRQGGQNLALRLYDVTDVDFAHQSPHSMQQYDCDELARDWYLPIPVSDRDYLVEIGYVSTDGRWLMLARSAPVRIPPTYPSDWVDDQTVTIDWEEELNGKTFATLTPPGQTAPTTEANPIYDRVFGLSRGAEAARIAGSLFGSMQQVPGAAISSFVFPPPVGQWTLPTPSGMGLSGVTMSGAGLFSGAAIPPRPRKFWLVADAELIVYGATEPDATVSIGGQPIPLNPDGTFRFQMSFQDGLIDYPILAVAKDGEQTRSIHLKFSRETPSRNTNTKEDAIDEWQS